MSGRSITPYEEFGQPAPQQQDAQLEEYVLRAGDTISGVADRFYDNWRQWRVIADHNAIKDVRVIAPGTVLQVPPPPLQSGRYEST